MIFPLGLREVYYSEVMKLIKNPFRLFLAPIIFIDVLKKRKMKHLFDYLPESRFLIIGVDKTGEFYSQEAKKLAIILQNSGINGITLVNNSSEMNVRGHQIQWFRIPAARENNYSRKEWNIIAERLLSSAIAVTKPQHIIFRTVLKKRIQKLLNLHKDYL